MHTALVCFMPTFKHTAQRYHCPVGVDILTICLPGNNMSAYDYLQNVILNLNLEFGIGGSGNSSHSESAVAGFMCPTNLNKTITSP